MFRYSILIVKHSKARVCLTIAGLSIAFAAIVFAYSIASRVDGISSRALLYVIDDSNVWISTGSATGIKPEVGNLVSLEPLERGLVESVMARAQGRLYRIATDLVDVNGVRVTLYADEREEALGNAAVISPDLAAAIGRTATDVTISQTRVPICGIRAGLPGVCIVVPYSLGKNLLANHERVDWLVGRVPNPKVWLQELNLSLNIPVADSPSAFSTTTTARGVAYLLEGSRSRIDPYSFRTKFSAYTYNRSLSTVVGWTARVVLMFGLIFAATSMSVSVKERRSEVAVFCVLGLQSEFTVLLLVEMLLVLLAVVPIGVAVAAGAVALSVPRADLVNCVLPGLAISFFFLPITGLLAGLWGGQLVAGHSELELVRGDA